MASARVKWPSLARGAAFFSALLQCEHRAQKSNAVELPPATLIAVSSFLLRVTRIVCRIHIVDHKRTHAVELDNGFRRRPSMVLHPGRHDQIAARGQLFPGCVMGLVSRADVKRAGNHRDMLSGW